MYEPRVSPSVHAYNAVVSFLAEILLQLLLQVLGEIVFELLFGLGDLATGGRMKRIALFALGGGGAGLASHLVRPGLVIPDAATRYAVVAGLAVAGGLFLAIVETRLLRRGKGAASAGFLSGLAFGLAYAGARRLMRP